MQLVLLLHKGHVFRIKRPYSDLQIGKQELSQLLLQLGPEGTVQQGPVHLLAGFLKGRPRLVSKVIFLVIELIPGINGMADIGQRQGGIDLPLDLVKLLIGFHRLISGSRLSNPLGNFLSLGLECRQIRTDIRHLTEFHRQTPPFIISGQVPQRRTRLLIASARPRGVGRCKG